VKSLGQLQNIFQKIYLRRNSFHLCDREQIGATQWWGKHDAKWSAQPAKKKITHNRSVRKTRKVEFLFIPPCPITILSFHHARPNKELIDQLFCCI